MALLRDYHAALGPNVARYEGTLQQRVVRHCHLSTCGGKSRIRYFRN